MFRRLAALSLVVLSVGLSQAARADDAQIPVTGLVPDNAILVLQVTDPKALIERAFDEQVVSMVQSLPPYQQAMSQPETQHVLGLVRFFEGKYGLKLPALLGKSVGGGITFAACPDDQVLLIVESEDATMLQEVHDFFRTIAQGEAVKQGDPERVKSAEYRGIQGWTFGGNESHAIVGNRLLVSNKPDLLKAALDRHADGGLNSLAQSANFAAARKSVGSDAKAHLYVDMRVLKQLPGFQQGLNQNENPLVRLLFAPLLAGAADANWLVAGMKLDQESLGIDVQADRGAGEPTALNSFAVPPTDQEGAMPNLAVPGEIAAMSFYRDLHKFYASKDELFPERTSGLIFFENMMGIFFTGKDLTEEVLAQTLPDMRFVVAQQQYDDTTGIPAMQLPGFALVLKLRDPDKFYVVMEEAWQKAIGLVNFTSGQKAQPGLIIKNATHHGTTYTKAYYSLAEESNKDAANIRYNFQPSLALQGNHLIMSSSDALVRDLIDALQQEGQQGTKPLAGQHSLALLEAAPLASILQANREAMVRQNMVEDGKSKADAEKEVDSILAALKYLDAIQITAGQTPDSSQLTIKIGYKLP